MLKGCRFCDLKNSVNQESYNKHSSCMIIRTMRFRRWDFQKLKINKFKNLKIEKNKILKDESDEITVSFTDQDINPVKVLMLLA